MKKETIILIGSLITLGLLTGGVAIYFYSSKRITVKANGKKLVIYKPAIKKPYFDASIKTQNVAKLTEIKSKYGNTVSKWADLNNIPVELVYSFIFIESSGNPSAVSADAYGLMQLGINTACDVVRRGVRDNTFTQSELILLKSKVSQYSKLMLSKLGDASQLISKNELFDAELNIMLGCKLLRFILDKQVNDFGEIRLDRCIVLWNRGLSFNQDLLKGNVSTVINTLSNDSYGKTSVTYIQKMLSTDGTLDLLMNYV